MKKQTLEQDGIKILVYSFELMDSRMYVIQEDDEIFVVDPCVEEALPQEVKGAVRAAVFLTHEHYDHISGVNRLREQFACTVYAGKVCAERIVSAQHNLSSRFPFLFLRDRETYQYVRSHFELPYTCKADTVFAGKGTIMWKGHLVELLETGGHSPGSSLIVFDGKFLFGGDNLLESGRVFRGTDGDPAQYREHVLPVLREFDPQITVLPGHGESHPLAYFLNGLTLCSQG
ncbi:MAG: MBL fold metallo-hydrolase [Bacteroidales bacterium]|nr:MBL fold metallo-hydrolase [Bacteroidales bacterium]MCM1416733.1 MBL fold metallo-hydrolase [bacterium]MCM1424760.1 MBL fold metallo-hydrolase [bacterium]